jgi:hypothetical protein
MAWIQNKSSFQKWKCRFCSITEKSNTDFRIIFQPMVQAASYGVSREVVALAVPDGFCTLLHSTERSRALRRPVKMKVCTTSLHFTRLARDYRCWLANRVRLGPQHWSPALLCKMVNTTHP